MKKTTILIFISFLLCFYNNLFSQSWQYEKDRFSGAKEAYVNDGIYKFRLLYSPHDSSLTISIGDFYGCAGSDKMIGVMFDDDNYIYAFKANCRVWAGEGRWFFDNYEYGYIFNDDKITGTLTILDLLNKIKNSNRMFIRLLEYEEDFEFPLSGSAIMLNKVIPKYYTNIYKRKMHEIDQDKKRKYNSLLNKGDSLYDEELYYEAIDKYKKAKYHTTIDTNLLLINEKIQKAKLKAEKNKQYNDLINEGNSLRTSNQFDEAIEKYEQAQQLNPNKEEPEIKINETKKAIKNKQYNDLIYEGNSLKASNQFNKAIEKYELAQKIQPNNKEPAIKINETIKEAENHKKYDKLISFGDSLYNKKKYDKAIEKYAEAQKIMPNRHYETSTKINQAKIKKNEKSDNIYFILVGLGGALIYLSTFLF